MSFSVYVLIVTGQFDAKLEKKRFCAAISVNTHFDNTLQKANFEKEKFILYIYLYNR